MTVDLERWEKLEHYTIGECRDLGSFQRDRTVG